MAFRLSLNRYFTTNRNLVPDANLDFSPRSVFNAESGTLFSIDIWKELLYDSTGKSGETIFFVFYPRVVTPPWVLIPDSPSENPASRENLAEGLGFEPREHLAVLNGFQDRRNSPLCHPSNNLLYDKFLRSWCGKKSFFRLYSSEKRSLSMFVIYTKDIPVSPLLNSPPG